MGKGRAPCCDKSQVKRGPWSPAEDLRLITFIQRNGHENWRALPKQAGLLRCGKSCRLRWINYLRPDVKRGNFTSEEEETIIKLHQTLGNKWSKIAAHLPGRTDNEIKNVWNTHLKKRLACYGSGEYSTTTTTTTSSSSSSSYSTAEACEKGSNMGTELDDQWGVTKKPRIVEDDVQDSQGEVSDELRPIEESPNEISSKNCSNNSNVTKMGDHDNQIVEQPGHTDHPYEVQSGVEEVNKPEMQGNGFEIPLEVDYDFWNMLEGISFLQSNGNEADASHDPNLGNAYPGEIENKMWFRFLENELGLDATKDGNQDETLPLKAQLDPVAGNHHCWP